jgi:hypothetical protein
MQIVINVAFKPFHFLQRVVNWSKKSVSLSLDLRSPHMHCLLVQQHPLVGITWNQFLLNFLRLSNAALVIPALPRERGVPCFLQPGQHVLGQKINLKTLRRLRANVDSSLLIFFYS